MSLSQLVNIIPLSEPDLQQLLDYATTLSKSAAATHFSSILGDTPEVVEFISSFNSRRKDPISTNMSQSSSQTDLSGGVPKSLRAKKKKAAPLHTPAPRQIQDIYAGQGMAYKKKNEGDYVSQRHTLPRSETKVPGLEGKPAAKQLPTTKPPPSAAGSLISDVNTKTPKGSRNASPAPQKTKVNITGGTSMHGPSSILSEFDSVIRSLEISTNSTLKDDKKRKCNCIGARHPLLTAAPNCLNCGKVICVKEGLGPCTFCGNPLLSAVEIQDMIQTLREERGREKMIFDNSSNRRAEVAKKPIPFAPKAVEAMMSPAEVKAKEHRDRLLGFQAQNAKRTAIHDEAADFETPMTGRTNLWASPAERAKQLRQQQKVLADQEWNARPEYEKRRQVISIDVSGKKAVKRMAAIERPKAPVEESEEEEEVFQDSNTSGNKGGGTFSRNPLLAGLIKPVWDSGKEKGNGKEKEGQEMPKRKMWRRVQDDLEDNEAIILDGGALGGEKSMEEPACG
ncbi:C2HC5 finger protein-like protein [Calycina marina]|uniref:C2HC5 finger protein-like protein n=1 Tax=Calycina marina TaxID=1763456 RepID=A0A9P7Z2D6_9HELO|nr:C2HC5 finger protein-like protein [Calycina marina]